ncbi:MAG: hypothetical protein WDO24_02645 [Pseudomonadota bacterium]
MTRGRVLIRGLTKRYQSHVAGRRSRPDRRARRARHPARTVGLRQDHDPALDRRADPPGRGGEISVDGKSLLAMPAHRRDHSAWCSRATRCSRT